MVAKGRGMGERSSGSLVRRCKLSYIEWVNDKVLVYTTGNYIQYPGTNHNGKECERYIYITELLCCTVETGLPWWLSSKESACNEGDLGLMPGSGRSSGGGHGNPVFLPGESHGQRSLVGYSSQGRKKSDTTEATEHARMHSRS